MKGSLRNSPNFVEFDLRNLGTSVPFVPEQIELETYTFLPFVRTGLAAALMPPAAGKLRATVPVSVTVQDDKGGSELVTRTVTLRGPGDVLGLDGAQIIRRVPSAGAHHVEESFLAHVEFDRPELPWLFTPAQPSNNRLRPWIALVVVEAAASSLEPGPAGLPTRLRTRLGQLQPTTDAWAWAHAQVVGPKSKGPKIAERLGESHSATNLSRLVCPRKLDPDTHYLAAVVPLYDVGVNAGLGLPGGTLDPAWTRLADESDADLEIVLPVYDAWRFTTGELGDFESLAKKLEAVPAPWNVGRRIIDASRPRGGMADLAPGDPGRLQVLRCALVSPASPPPEAPPEGVNWAPAKRQELLARIDTAGSAPQGNDLPRVSPRIYARWQKAQATVGTVSDSNWFPQLNSSPVHRIVAGLGTRVVRKDQEQLMQAAWLQVGEVQAANALLNRLQFSRYVADSLHRNHLGKLGLGEIAQVVRGAQDKVRLPGGTLTIHGTVGQSATPPAAVSPAFRRMTRVRGPLARLLGEKEVGALRRYVATDEDGFRDLRRQYAEPDSIRGLRPETIAWIPAQVLAEKLKVDPKEAHKAFAEMLEGRKGDLTIADRGLAPIEGWNVASGELDLGAELAQQVYDLAVASLPEQLWGDTARVEAVAPLLAGVAGAGVKGVSELAAEMLGQITGQSPGQTGGGPSAPLVQSASGGIRSEATTPSASEAARPAAGPPAPELRRPTATVADASPQSITNSLPAESDAATVTRPAVYVGPEVPVMAEPAAARGAVPGREPPREPPRGRDYLDTHVARQIAETIAAARRVPMEEIARAFSEMMYDDGVRVLEKTPERPALAVARKTLLDAFAPRTTLSNYARSRFRDLPSWLPADWFENGRIDRIMAAPRFDRPMFEALDAYDRDWLMPGLGTIEETDFVTVLLTNPAFTETFLVGLSDEMGRELLWRGYPTDQRGTYFWRFWDAEQDELDKPIHAFKPTSPLGGHIRTAGAGAQGRVVLVIRGELLQRYPDAVVLAVRAKQNLSPPEFEDPSTSSARILFHAHLPPDITLVGFDLTAAQVHDENWWFVIAENPTEPRFGLDLVPAGGNGPAAPGTKRDALDWNDLGTLADKRFLRTGATSPVPFPVGNPGGDPNPLQWANTSAMVAGTLLQNPVRAAFSAKQLIGSLLT